MAHLAALRLLIGGAVGGFPTIQNICNVLLDFRSSSTVYAPAAACC